MDWRCQQCGEVHDADDPPCSVCGHGAFVPARNADRSADDADTMMQWVCASCGRGQPKNAPPCSRCGHMDLEYREVRIDESELDSGGYLDLATPGYLAVFVVAMIGLAAIGLAVAGVVDLPGTTPADPPAAPGNATTADGRSLADLETGYVDALNDRRADGGATTVRRSDDLDAIATSANRWVVRSEFGDDEVPSRELATQLRDECGEAFTITGVTIPPDAYASPDAPGERIADRALASRADLATTAADRVGVDAHVAPDDTLYLTTLLC